MDEACDTLPTSLSSPQPHFIKNPFEAKFLCEFSSPKSGKLFIDRGKEGWYAFALHVDFFNPEGMNLWGTSMSSGIISMACLNLLLNIRYKPENMYLAGIIPSPQTAFAREPQPLCLSTHTQFGHFMGERGLVLMNCQPS
ncbi:hypothetical protein M404DRAFT_132764 [Pisolithus tinctorius Marx 270]|uniref:Uncharacterized protein n=1 Tax=Pisolithus tinctorius Marx 270 TaxID=870435 RepID=A0A0C3KI41_PISTI|nr:hypothetical protein M404DRAFT_132764 [Pisolithus tinctorius Marx 270]